MGSSSTTTAQREPLKKSRFWILELQCLEISADGGRKPVQHATTAGDETLETTMSCQHGGWTTRQHRFMVQANLLQELSTCKRHLLVESKNT